MPGTWQRVPLGGRVGSQRLAGAKHGAKSSLARTLLSLTVFYCCSTALIWALDPGRRISQYAHTAWRVQDGSIDIGSSITQTTDGYLWLGTPEGLLRFDGIKFVPFLSPALTSQNLLIRTFWALATAVCGLEREIFASGSDGAAFTPTNNLVRSGRPIPPHTLERPGEPSLQELSKLRRSLELRDRLECLECRRERIREAPDGS